MTKLEFSLNLPANSDKLMQLATDYENFVNYLPDQIKSVKIIEKNSNETITEEVLVFTTIMKNEIVQSSKHKKVNPNQLQSEIISGPFSGSKLLALYAPVESGTKVTITANLKIPLKYKVISLVIKKMYKIILTGILYKMNRIALDSSKIDMK